MSTRSIVRAGVLGALVAGLAACSGGGGGGGGGPINNGNANSTFALTDAESDDLSSLQVEVTRLSITDTNGVETQIFPLNGMQTQVVNLLRLRDVQVLLGNVQLPAATYANLTLSFQNAQAIDDDGNPLTVTPNAGDVFIQLTPPVTLGQGNVFFQLDFDVEDSVANVTPGPGGSVTINPVIVVRVDTNNDLEVDDFEGTITAVAPDRITVALGIGTVDVVVNANTEIEIDDQDINAAGLDLTTVFNVGDQVEVDGNYDPILGVVVADEIEVDDDNDGPNFKGLVVAVAAGSFDVLVTEGGGTPFAPGSVQTVTFDANTDFEYDNPDVDAQANQLGIGQEVRVNGFVSSPAQARKVRLRRTRLSAVVNSVDNANRQASITVSEVEGVNVTSIPGFDPQVTVTFSNAIPGNVRAGATVNLQVQFNLSAPGSADVVRGDDDDDDDDDGDDDDDNNDGDDDDDD